MSAAEGKAIQATPQAPGASTYLTLTTDNVKAALIEARGDIFIASQLLGTGVTAVRLDRVIRMSDELQLVVAGIREAKNSAEYAKASAQDFQEAVNRRLALYRISGLDALHELATMPLNDNSAQNQVKLAAAARLAGPAEQTGPGGELAETLRALNVDYHETAPRIRVVRERLTVELTPGERDVTPVAGEAPARDPLPQ